jgi:hypothetical protein
VSGKPGTGMTMFGRDLRRWSSKLWHAVQEMRLSWIGAQIVAADVCVTLGRLNLQRSASAIMSPTPFRPLSMSLMNGRLHVPRPFSRSLELVGLSRLGAINPADSVESKYG